MRGLQVNHSESLFQSLELKKSVVGESSAWCLTGEGGGGWCVNSLHFKLESSGQLRSYGAEMAAGRRKPDWITWRGAPEGCLGSARWPLETVGLQKVGTRAAHPLPAEEVRDSWDRRSPPKEQPRYSQEGNQHLDSKPPRDPISHYDRTRQIWARAAYLFLPSLQPRNQILQGRQGMRRRVEQLVTPLPPSALVL